MRKILTRFSPGMGKSRNMTHQHDDDPCPPCAYKEALRRWLGEEVDGRGTFAELLDEEAIAPRAFGS